jgi:putative adenylate-forming enzyme
MIPIRLLTQYLKTKYIANKIDSKEKLSTLQEKKWLRFKKTVLKKSSFYKPYLDKPLAQFPIIDKSIMMKHFDQINTVGIKKNDGFAVALKAEQSRDFSPMIGNITVGLSSGTSGNQGLFLASKKERALWAGTLLAKALPRGLFHHEKIAFFLRANNQLYQTLAKSKRIEFKFFDLLDDFNRQINTLNHYQPTIICAPASVLFALAKAQSQKTLTITPIKILSCAEVLDNHQKQFIESAFSIRTDEIYQATEGFLAISNQTKCLTLNEEFLIVEKLWLDDKRFIPIITDLMRHSQPIVRYRLDDVLVVNNDKINVMTQLAYIEGREADICYGVNDLNKKVMLFSDVIRQKMTLSMIAFDDYQIAQKSLGEFSIAVTPKLSTKEKQHLIMTLNSLFVEKNCILPRWNWHEVNHNNSGEKKRRIQCEIDKP